jgi:hypothetical protein
MPRNNTLTHWQACVCPNGFEQPQGPAFKVTCPTCQATIRAIQALDPGKILPGRSYTAAQLLHQCKPLVFVLLQDPKEQSRAIQTLNINLTQIASGWLDGAEAAYPGEDWLSLYHATLLKYEGHHIPRALYRDPAHDGETS